MAGIKKGSGYKKARVVKPKAKAKAKGRGRSRSSTAAAAGSMKSGFVKPNPASLQPLSGKFKAFSQAKAKQVEGKTKIV